MDLVKTILPLIVVGIALSIGMLVIVDVKEEITNVNVDNSTAYNATKETEEAIADIPGWLPIIVLVLIGMVLIGLVTKFARN